MKEAFVTTIARIAGERHTAHVMRACLAMILLASLMVGTRAAAARDASPNLTVTLEEAQHPGGIRISRHDANTDDALAGLGLFIGIDRYPNLINEDLEGCVHDAWQMMLLMTQRFGIRSYSMLTNAKATREGIADALHDLVRRVERLRATGNTSTIPIVITFSGHGRQVIDLVGDEEDGLDETWIAADSGPDARHDIRDDELHLVLSRLTALNTTVLLISDSCHSGTMHRTSHRVRSVRDATPPPGPDDRLFTERFGSPDQRKRRRGHHAEPGLIFFAACHEARQAVEHEEAPGVSSGRFTFALRRALARSGPETTYRQLFAKIVLEFERNWPGDRTQRPYFHADPRTAGERFLTGGRPVAHATIVRSAADPDDDTVRRLSMGAIDGVAPGARFTFFRNLDDLTKGHQPIATGRVLTTSPLSSLVRLGAPGDLPATAVAALDMVRIADVRVHLHDDVPAVVRRAVRALDDAQQMQMVDDAATADFVIMRSSAAHDQHAPPPADHETAVEVHHAGALGATKHPIPIARIPADPASDEKIAAEVTDVLLHIGKVLRLLRLETVSRERIDPTLDTWRRDGDDRLIAVPRGAAEGVYHLHAGDLFTASVSSNAATPLYVTVLAINDRFELDIIYPLEESDPDVLRPGRTLTIAADNPFVASRSDACDDKDSASRVRLIIIASGSRIDLTPLTARTTRSGTRPASGIRDLLHDLGAGGPALRSGTSGSLDEPFAATTLLIDISSALPSDRTVGLHSDPSP